MGPLNAFEMAEPQAHSKEVIAVVEIGFKSSIILILDAGELMLNRVVAIGGDRLTGALAEGINITYVEAENIKVGMPAEVQPHLEAALRLSPQPGPLHYYYAQSLLQTGLNDPRNHVDGAARREWNHDPDGS